MKQTVVTLIFLGMAVGVVSYDIAKTTVFEDLRWQIQDKIGIDGWPAQLIYCPYCISHWLSFGVIAIYQPERPFKSFALLDYFIMSMAVVAIATVVIAICTAMMLLLNFKKEVK